MIKKLITDFFNAIEERELKKNKNAKATFWVEDLQEVGYNDKNYIGVKKATRLYEKYIEEKKNISNVGAEGRRETKGKSIFHILCLLCRVVNSC